MTHESSGTQAATEGLGATTVGQDLDAEGFDRKLPRNMAVAVAVLSALYALFHLAVLNFWAIDEWVYRVVHVNMGAILGFIGLKMTRGETGHKVTLPDWLLVAGAIACTAYVAINLQQLIMRTGVITTTGDFIAGVVGTIVVLEFARRVSGLVLPVIALIFVGYVLAERGADRAKCQSSRGYCSEPSRVQRWPMLWLRVPLRSP